MADHAFFQYERTLQREYNSELVIHLPAPQALIAVGSADAVVSPVSLLKLWQLSARLVVHHLASAG